MSASSVTDQHEESTSSRSAPPGFSTNDFASRRTQVLELLEKITEKYQNESKVVEQYSKQTDLLVSVVQYALLSVTISKQNHHIFLEQIIKTANSLLSENRANLKVSAQSSPPESDQTESGNTSQVNVITDTTGDIRINKEIEKSFLVQGERLMSSDRLTDDGTKIETVKISIMNEDQSNNLELENFDLTTAKSESGTSSSDDVSKNLDGKIEPETLNKQLYSSLVLSDSENAPMRTDEPTNIIELPVSTLNDFKLDDLSLDDLMKEYSVDDNEYSHIRSSSTLDSDKQNNDATIHQIPIDTSKLKNGDEIESEIIVNTQIQSDQSSTRTPCSSYPSVKAKQDALPISLHSILISARLSSQDAADEADCIWKEDISVFGKVFCRKNMNDEPKLVQRVSSCLLCRPLYERLTNMIRLLPKEYTPRAAIVNSLPTHPTRNTYENSYTRVGNLHRDRIPTSTYRINTAPRNDYNESSNTNTPYTGNRPKFDSYQHGSQTHGHDDHDQHQNAPFISSTDPGPQSIRRNNGRFPRNQRQSNRGNYSPRQPTHYSSHTEQEQYHHSSNAHLSNKNQPNSDSRHWSNSYENRSYSTKRGPRNGRFN